MEVHYRKNKEWDIFKTKETRRNFIEHELRSFVKKIFNSKNTHILFSQLYKEEI